jgi:hypothetical protein
MMGATMAGLLQSLARWLPALRVRPFDAAAGGRRWQGVQTFGNVNAEIGAAAGPVRRRASYYARNNPWVANGVKLARRGSGRSHGAATDGQSDGPLR